MATDNRKRQNAGSGPRRAGRTRAAAGPAPARSVRRQRRPSEPAVAGQVRRVSLTGRALVLVVVLLALVLTLAYPLRSYLEQRGHIADLRQSVAAQKQKVASLEDQRRRWDDPAYVRAQARTRLHYVMPGETQYVVLEPDEAPGDAPASAKTDAGAKSPWFSQLWGSVQDAAHPGTEQAARATGSPGR